VSASIAGKPKTWVSILKLLLRLLLVLIAGKLIGDAIAGFRA
jgi:hypothetical protein